MKSQLELPFIGWNADGIPCGTPGVNDFDFFEAILGFSQKELCVDMDRVYSVGFSTGAFLSYGIACRYPDRVAGVGTDAGGISKRVYDICESSGSGPVPMQSFHSLSDPTVPYGTLSCAYTLHIVTSALPVASHLIPYSGRGNICNAFTLHLPSH